MVMGFKNNLVISPKEESNKDIKQFKSKYSEYDDIRNKVLNNDHNVINMEKKTRAKSLEPKNKNKSVKNTINIF